MTAKFEKFAQRPQYVSNKVNPQLFDLIDGFRNHLAVVDTEKSTLLLKKAIIFLRSLQQAPGLTTETNCLKATTTEPWDQWAIDIVGSPYAQ